MFNVNRVGGGDMLDGDQVIKYGHYFHCPQVHGDLDNHDNGNINGSSNLIIIIVLPLLLPMMMALLVTLPILVFLRSWALCSCLPSY